MGCANPIQNQYTPPDGMLQVSGGGALTNSQQNIADNAGNISPFRLSKIAASLLSANTVNADYDILSITNPNANTIAGMLFNVGGYKGRIRSNSFTGLFEVVSDNSSFGGAIIHNATIKAGWNASGFYVGNSLTQNGALTVKGAGGNIVSFRSSANAEVLTVDDAGNVAAAAALFPGGARIGGNAGADIGYTNNGATLASGNNFGWSAGASPSAPMDTDIHRAGPALVSPGNGAGGLGSFASNNNDSNTYSVGGAPGVDGTILSADAKTVTFTKGIATSIV